MSIRPCTAISPRPDSEYRPQGQDAPGGELLQLPPNIIGRIGNFVATGNTPLEAATNGVLWSRVCVYTHVSSHQSGVAQRVQQALEDDALLKMWGPLSGQLNFNGNPPPQTLAEIKAWFDDPANAEQLNAITQLDLANLELKAIPPQITRCTQLQILNLNNNQITDVSPLGNFTQLLHLHLISNKITDISALGNLAQLQRLSLSENQITDISALGNLPQLQNLDLYKNQITDVSALGNLVQLEWLSLSGNQITNVSALGDLSQLQSLLLSNNWITDVSPLGNLAQLQILGLSQNRITDVSALRNLANLQKLYLSQNQITDVSALRNLEQLNRLGLNNNQITDVSALRNLEQLQRLGLTQNLIIDVSPLGNLPQLEVLDLSINQITDVSPLGNLVQLQVLDLNNNQITDVSALRNLEQLNRLGLTQNLIIDVSPIGNLPQLEVLDLSINQITDVSPLGNLAKLTLLWLQNNPVTNLSGLEKLTAFITIDRNSIFFMSIDYQNESSFSVQETLNKQNEFKTYNCKSPLSSFIQFMAQKNVGLEETRERFSQLDPQDKNLIYRMVYQVRGSDSTDPQWGEHHVFDNKAVFYRAVREAISAKFEGLSQNDKNMVYGQIYELAGRPETNDPKWGEHNALENLLRLVDAMNRAAYQ